MHADVSTHPLQMRRLEVGSMCDTLAVNHQEYLHWTYFGDKAMDGDEFDRLGQLFKGVERFIDVGASHGVYTYYATQHLTAGRVVAIEADPERFAILENNVAQWNETTPVEIRCMMAAVTDAKDLAKGPTTTFFTTGTQISGGLFPVGERSDDYVPIEVSQIQLDDFADDAVPTLVKIDVEGGELRVLQGAPRLIAAGHTAFFVELSWWGDRDRKTSVFTTLRHIYKSGLGIERRLRSDYLLTPEPDQKRRLLQMLKVVPPLFPRYVFAAVVPFSLRRRLIRRQNEKRLARMAGSDTASDASSGTPGV